MRQALISWAATSCFLILAVVVLRWAFGRRMSAGLRYALWGLALVRLLVPVQLFTSPVVGTVIESERIVTKETKTEREVLDALGGQDGPPAVATAAPYFPAAPAMPDPPAVPDAPDWRLLPAALGWVWLGGAILMAAVLAGCNLRFWLRLRRTRRLLEGQSPATSWPSHFQKRAYALQKRSDRAKSPLWQRGCHRREPVTGDCSLPVYVAENLPSPCLFGVFRPAIYVAPETAADPAALRHVLAHESTHYRHGDHVWSLLRCAALCVHWWNPLVWLAARLSRRDGELACDEGALKRLGDGERAAYGATLLALVAGKPAPGGPLTCSTAMTGDKKSLTERFARIAHAPKRAAGIGVAAIILAALVTVCAFGQKTLAPTPWEELEADLSLTVEDDGTVRVTGTVDGMALPRGAFWYPPDSLFSDSPYGKLYLVYPRFTDGIEGQLYAWWADESHTAVNLSTQMMAGFSSYWPSGYWEFTVDFSGGEAVVTRMEAIAGFPEGMEVQMHPETIPDGEAVRAGRIAARLLTAAEEYYRDWEEKGGAPQPDEPLRYSGVTRVTGEFEYPPFETFTLTGREANELLDCLSALELSDDETTGVPEGDGVTYTVETPGGSYSFGALKPYFLYDGSAYRLGMDSELFQVTDRIAASRTGTAGAVTDIPVPVGGSAPPESAPVETPAPVPPPAQELSDMTELPCHPDLNRNGVKETLLVGYYYETMDEDWYAPGLGVWEDGKLLWTSVGKEEGGTKTAYLLTEQDGEEYLMECSVWSGDGRCAYSYLGYDLRAPGQQSIFNGDTHFVYARGEYDEYAIEINEYDITAFMENINSLLSRSTVLYGGGDVFPDPSNPRLELSWLEHFAAGFTWDRSTADLENLTRFEEAANRPNLAPAPVDPARARTELREALLGQREFVFYSAPDSNWAVVPAVTVDINAVPQTVFPLTGEYGEIWSFAVLDLDEDGNEEVVLHIGGVAGDAGGYLVLHWAGPGDIRAHPSYWRTFWNLKTDGTFYYDYYMDTTGIGQVSFPDQGYAMVRSFIMQGQADMSTHSDPPEGIFTVRGETVTYEEYLAALEKQDEKPDEEWYEFTPENVEQALE